MSSSTSCSAAHTWIHSPGGVQVWADAAAAHTGPVSWMSSRCRSSAVLTSSVSVMLVQKAMYVYNDPKTTDFSHGGSPLSFQDTLSLMGFASRTWVQVVLSNSYTDATSRSKRRLYVGLQAVHVDGAVFFALLQVPRRNRRLLPLRLRPDALLQLNQPGHVRRDELVFDPWRRRPVVSVVVVAVHQRRVVLRRVGLADQRHLGADGETGSGEKIKACGRKVINCWEGYNLLFYLFGCLIYKYRQKNILPFWSGLQTHWDLKK